MNGYPNGNRQSRDRPWFAVVPDAWRIKIVERPAAWFGVDPSAAAFGLTRIVTSAMFLVVAGVLAWHVSGSREPVDWLRAAFLTAAWLWLLSPTQNPWYWIWAMPLVMFAQSRAWLAVSGLALLYYLRFWREQNRHGTNAADQQQDKAGRRGQYQSKWGAKPCADVGIATLQQTIHRSSRAR